MPLNGHVPLLKNWRPLLVSQHKGQGDFGGGKCQLGNFAFQFGHEIYHMKSTCICLAPFYYMLPYDTCMVMWICCKYH